jgi:hypothetical protein
MHKFVLLFCFVALGNAPVHGQERADAPVGRYQVAQVTPADFATIDTTTGECWVVVDDRWIGLKFPIKDTKVTDGKVGRFRLDVLWAPRASYSLQLLDSLTPTQSARRQYLPPRAQSDQ